MAIPPWQPFHSCSCGLVFSFEGYRASRFIGLMHIESGYTLEMRLCHGCSSTMSRELLPVTAEIAAWLDDAQKDAAE